MAGREPPMMPGRPLPSSFDGNDDFYNEKPFQKAFRKLKEEPLVPLGIGLTVFAFVNAYRALRKGDSQQANRMFRARVAAQGFTVIAMVAGSMYYSKDREMSKELRVLKEQKENEEKRQKWIRELEVRDEEEKAMRARFKEKMLKAAENAEAEANTNASSPNSGGVLGKMGLWPQSDKEQDAVLENPSESAGKKPKRDNPKSSLGVIGEAFNAQKKGIATKTASDGSKEEPGN
ncbi:hypothetical protein S7711_01143 [Stachybotrys chartarum IBT 7711]|uniref:HIG1 domain-containing protein n=1 Tax=Stachybotrys chartarum (strain CBS 109288 / IBT 7711) TaxID=1280523 RepID=A0A084AST6_STACB|nr:hypothetical protein S7711_01143 [Stachybotrys chartarum IBT 7711]KFA48983.1 hypothetical protein S40293_02546 [Stachybotrys chartarum IBT 40293]KFA72269.1 hypothetical protein S40288_02437 [Stachybotrys chartarum IBT 40288]